METKTIVIIILVLYMWFWYNNPAKGVEYIDLAKDNIQGLVGNIKACPTTYDPVCVNGTNYDNSCLAQKAGYNDMTAGVCE